MSDSLLRPGGRPPKGMRLGTRSCAECRRRKVRCVFQPGRNVCEACALHNSPCRAQQPSHRRHTKQAEEDENDGLHRRLEELESLVSCICGTIDLSTGSSTLANWKTTTLEAIRRLRPESVGQSNFGDNQSGAWTSPQTSSTSEIVHTPSDESDEIENYGNAPLIKLFKDAMMIEKNETRVGKVPPDLGLDRRIRDSIRALRTLIPRSNDLKSILEATEKYWPLWPACYHGPSPPNRIQSGGATSVMHFISDALTLGNPALVAKVTLWLALCIQQLPRGFARQLELPALPEALIQSYVEIARALLFVGTDLGETIDDLECLMLQCKLYINIGKIRKAWLSARHAVNTALLLGLHHVEGGDERREHLWSQIWHVERMTSLLLGFQCAIPNSHPAISKESVGASVVQRVTHQMCIIAGAVIERDQSYRTANYSTTVQIDQDLERCRNLIPEDWWEPSPSLSLEDLYYRQYIKLQYFTISKYVHLPYMLKSTTERKFEHSRMSAVEASRGIILSYQTLRNSSATELVMCELMDFEAFCAAIVIVIDLLSQPSRRNPGEDVEDWRLVESMALSLRRTSTLMECAVAAQGAQILEFLAMAHRGAYHGPERYEAVIPYFGKVQINWVKEVGPRAEPTRSSNHIHGQNSPTSTIEFSTNPFGHVLSMEPNFEAELGIDWSTILDVNNNYDWIQTSYPNGAA